MPQKRGLTKHELEQLRKISGKTLQSGKMRGTNTTELSQAIMAGMGGVEGFVHKCITLLDDPEVPPSQKVAIMRGMMDLVKADTALTGGRPPIEDMSPDEVDREILSMVKDMGLLEGPEATEAQEGSVSLAAPLGAANGGQEIILDV